MTNPVNSDTNKAILWQQLWGLAILQAAISFSWTVYFFSQAPILKKFGFGYLIPTLYIASGALGGIIEPLVGWHSDKIQHKLGSRFPMINLGVILTSLIFLTVAFGLQTNIVASFAWIVPTLMLFWIASMKLFQTPAISLMWRYAPPQQLPFANSSIILVFGLVGALAPFVTQMITHFGFALTFTLGGVVLFIAATMMRRLTPVFIQAPSESTMQAREIVSTPVIIFVLIFIVGFCLQLTTAPIYYIAPAAIQKQLLGKVNIEYITAGILLVTGVMAIPLGKWASKVGIHFSLLLGFILMAGFLGLQLITTHMHWLFAVLLMIGLGIGASLIYNAGIPFALTAVSGTRASLGTGLFYGGGGTAYAILAYFRFQIKLTVLHMFVVALICVPVVYLCLKHLRSLKKA